jgi:hypothetical protein
MKVKLEGEETTEHETESGAKCNRHERRIESTAERRGMDGREE